MARCSCGNATCSCVIKPDPASGGVTITGSGSPTRPYLIGLASGGDIRSQIGVSDTPTLNLEMGAPDSNGKSTIYGYATQRMTDLADVADLEGPQEGDVPVWTNGHWEFKPQGTVNPGAISAINGIGGDGSVADPLRALTSGTWPLPLFTATSPRDTGQPLYIDSTGLLRSRPQVMRGPKPATDLPATYPYGMTVMGIGTSDAAGWPPGLSCVVVTYVREDTPVAMQWCYWNNVTTPQAWFRSGNTSWSPWVVTISDTGWTDIAIQSGFAVQGTEKPQVRLFNGAVYVRGGWSPTGLTVAGNYDVGLVPVGFRPLTTQHMQIGTGLANVNATALIGSTGMINLRVSSPFGNYYIFGGSSWLID